MWERRVEQEGCGGGISEVENVNGNGENAWEGEWEEEEEAWKGRTRGRKMCRNMEEGVGKKNIREE